MSPGRRKAAGRDRARRAATTAGRTGARGATGTESNPIFFRGAAEYRAWLERNHGTATELWIGYWKKATGKPSLTWPETVDESLCFGWIDGIRKSIDADSFKQRVTPRRPRSIWSRINIARVAALTEQGRMQPAGLAAYRKRDVTKAYSFEQEHVPALRPEYVARFRKASPGGWKYYEAQPPGRRRMVTWWVMSARKEETRLRRLATLIEACDAGRPVGVLTTKPARSS